MKTFPVAAFVLALVQSALGCSTSDGTKILAWMNACDVVPGNSTAKCADRECHKALHYLEEEETAECYVQLGLGLSTDLDYYKLLDARSDDQALDGFVRLDHGGLVGQMPQSRVPQRAPSP
ncbi:hypothetical protein P43SY_011671 [Pythium insidiosum]|uniref:Uncharacterized protein n=1 Tax=Pythium insidiosum TaxID=114742 RepID=A0AAD5LP44_PYTIN|nr:hypothetical protein P43SY_011671 [Pythium insidiosum]KAJ0390018.1 hypothetical protein ATCC90586_011318 [Pythium insidiosum]